jgi:hypothetical protein|tara:strand:- start:264 stop:872 length:609 start_codon:yes stop_codon:yes gene_type:complete
MDPIWIDNVSILLRKDRLHEFVPSKLYHVNENINAICRFCLYSGLILSIYKKDPMCMLISIYLTLLIGKIGQIKMKESQYKSVQPAHNEPFINKMVQKDCTKPTINNPFANVTYNDYSNPERPPACPSEEVKEEIDNAFFSNFEKHPYDIHNNKHSQRQFFSTANTKIPNDQDAFATWLYGDLRTCKTDNSLCTGNEAFGSG